MRISRMYLCTARRLVRRCYSPAPTMYGMYLHARTLATSWPAENTHLHPYFLRVTQGDLLTLELAWAATHFDRPLPLPDQCTGRTQGEVRLFKLVRGPELEHMRASAKAADCTQLTCPADGDDCLELRLFGPPAWRTQPVSSFVDLRLWGAYLQRPHRLRDFALENVWVEDWYQQLMPVPRH
ncbi:hypothetical protein [Xanthomonas vasicola]|uniref:hypothetical protein n=1 Tax=Xanthomonas vasicola TaxID=56459 RepID=UPI00210DF1C9|nr:hypothetical protein [Xanthomonas vasicola]MDO6968252.1 hypothetical protein [Xanthomonas vasicola]